jgi:hypothetical protein
MHVPFSQGLLFGRIVKAGRFQRGYVSRNRRATAERCQELQTVYGVGVILAPKAESSRHADLPR